MPKSVESAIEQAQDQADRLGREISVYKVIKDIHDARSVFYTTDAEDFRKYLPPRAQIFFVDSAYPSKPAENSPKEIHAVVVVERGIIQEVVFKSSLEEAEELADRFAEGLDPHEDDVRVFSGEIRKKKGRGEETYSADMGEY